VTPHSKIIVVCNSQDEMMAHGGEFDSCDKVVNSSFPWQDIALFSNYIRSARNQRNRNSIGINLIPSSSVSSPDFVNPKA
jgi:hypothetical protein